MLAKRRHVPPTVQRQKIKDMEFADAPYPGATLFAVSKSWWELWVAFVGYNDGQKRETRSMKRYLLVRKLKQARETVYVHQLKFS